MAFNLKNGNVNIMDSKEIMLCVIEYTCQKTKSIKWYSFISLIVERMYGIKPIKKWKVHPIRPRNILDYFTCSGIWIVSWQHGIIINRFGI